MSISNGLRLRSTPAERPGEGVRVPAAGENQLAKRKTFIAQEQPQKTHSLLAVGLAPPRGARCIVQALSRDAATLPGTARRGRCAPHCVLWHRPLGQVRCSAGEHPAQRGYVGWRSLGAKKKNLKKFIQRSRSL